MYEKYGTDHFIIVAFPANNFGEQEPGSNAEIRKFCNFNYHGTFLMMSMISITGEEIDPLKLAHFKVPKWCPGCTGHLEFLKIHD